MTHSAALPTASPTKTNRAPAGVCVLALDLDDTLLRSDHSISPATLDVIRHWRTAGRHVVIATGRPPRAVAGQLPAELDGVPWIVYNGAVIYLEGEKIYENLIPATDAHAIVARLQTSLPDHLIGVEIDDVLYMNQVTNRPHARVVTDLTTVATQPCAKVLFFAESFVGLDPLFSAMPAGVRVMISEKYKLGQIMSRSADKAEALKYLVQRWSLSMGQVVAFGDDINDVDMIAACGMGVAVANAIADVKAVATRVTHSNDEDGVAAILRELLGIP